jgi:Fe-S cluster assembly iron-binding protein IscA
MLNVTESAREHFLKMLQKADAPPEAAVRIMASEEEGPTLSIDTPAATDTTYEHKGRVVLVVGDESIGPLAGRTIDTHANENGEDQMTID